jgi:hypothetical protein
MRHAEELILEGFMMDVASTDEVINKHSSFVA